MVRGTLWPISRETEAKERRCRGGSEEEQECGEEAGGEGEGYCEGRSRAGEAI